MIIDRCRAISVLVYEVALALNVFILSAPVIMYNVCTDSECHLARCELRTCQACLQYRPVLSIFGGVVLALAAIHLKSFGFPLCDPNETFHVFHERLAYDVIKESAGDLHTDIFQIILAPFITIYT